jgi:uncharacterized damage-inducible protein DinB
MNAPSPFVLYARYNQWMNRNLYAACATLPNDALRADKGAFFGSILGTLNHLLAGDTIWLKRFAALPARHSALDRIRELPPPSGLRASFGDTLEELDAQRPQLDADIIAWIDQLTPGDLAQVLRYTTTKGVPGSKPLASVLSHFFNHQTHHRGQVTTLLSQAGVDVGVTDMLMLIPNEA